MDPQAIKDLLQVANFKSFLSAIAQAAAKLNTLDPLPNSDLDQLTDPVAFSVEVKARKRAYDLLQDSVMEVLALDTDDVKPGTKLSDYVV